MHGKHLVTAKFWYTRVVAFLSPSVGDGNAKGVTRETFLLGRSSEEAEEAETYGRCCFYRLPVLVLTTGDVAREEAVTPVLPMAAEILSAAEIPTAE